MREVQTPRQDDTAEMPEIPQLPSVMEVIEKNGWLYAVLPNGKLLPVVTL